jgi:hypothetical protein
VWLTSNNPLGCWGDKNWRRSLARSATRRHACESLGVRSGSARAGRTSTPVRRAGCRPAPRVTRTACAPKRPGACARVGVLPLPSAAWRRTVAATVSAAIPSARATPCTSLRRAGAASRARRARTCRAGRARAAGRLIAGAAWHAASNGAAACVTIPGTRGSRTPARRAGRPWPGGAARARRN